MDYTIDIPIQEMSCASCVRTIETKMRRLEGVKEAHVHFQAELATITFNPNIITLHTIIHEIKALGYTPVTQTLQFSIKGMSCVSCAHHIEQVLLKHPEIVSSTIHFATERATVTLVNTSAENVRLQIEKLGYKASLISEAHKNQFDIQKKEKKVWMRKRQSLLYLSALLTFPFLYHMLSMIGIFPPIRILDNPWVQWMLATPVQFYVGKEFYIKAFKAVRNKTANMDVLIVLGTSAAYIYSVINTYRNIEGVYFETSALIITLVLLGKTLEYQARSRTSEVIEKMLTLQAKEARVLQNGKETLLPIEKIAIGDIVFIRPGEKIPVDGDVIHGFSTVDQSMLTGESIPIDKTIGDKVYSGTMNTQGALQIEASRVGKETAIAHIIQVVEQAQNSKAPIQKTADTVASYFAITVLGIAILTGMIWFFSTGSFVTALMNSVAVLVIACPCALGLATPLSLMVGMGKGAKRGILFRNGEALEKVQQVTTVALDKTGTITTGKQEVIAITPRGNWNEEEVLRLASIAEKNSEHPLGIAITNKAKETHLEIPEPHQFHSFPGKGVTATFQDKEIHLGKKSFLTSHGVLENFPETVHLQREGKTIMYMAINNQLAATFTIADTVKSNSKKAILQLQKNHIHVTMLTGDHVYTAGAIGKQVGINDIVAGLLPEEKADEIKRRQNQGEIVAMTGDGVNDAPALATADVGIALGTGSDIALETGEITLLQGDLQSIVTAIQLSRQTMRNIKQNLFWAFFYNAVGIPLAAAGLLAPWIAGAAMAFSSLSVVLNALRLKRG